MNFWSKIEALSFYVLVAVIGVFFMVVSAQENGCAPTWTAWNCP